jgi:hypothetical protein
MAFQIKNTFACAENWDKMNPTEKGKFCEVCTKEVIDFTTLSKNEIIAVFKKNNYQALCARAYSTQLSTIYFEDSLENVSWNLPFWQKFLLVFLICFGPEFLNINLVFAQDSTVVQTEDVFQDKIKPQIAQLDDSTKIDSVTVSSFGDSIYPFLDLRMIEQPYVFGGVMLPDFHVKFPIIDFTYLDVAGYVLLVETDIDSNQQKEDPKQVPIKNFLKNFEETKIYLQTQLSPVKPEKKKEVPEKLLFVPLTTAMKPKSERQNLF